MYRELEEFIRAHRPCGGMTGDAGTVIPRGYLVAVSCRCGKVFEGWATPEEVKKEVLRSRLLALANRAAELLPAGSAQPRRALTS